MLMQLVFIMVRHKEVTMHEDSQNFDVLGGIGNLDDTPNPITSSVEKRKIMKIKRSELFRMREVIQSFGKAATFKFSYACAKNLRLIKDEIEDMQKILEPDEQIEQFEKERITLCSAFAKKEGGNPLITENRFEIEPTKKDEFNVKMEELREKYAEPLSLNMKKVESYNKAIKEEVDLPFHLVKLSDLPLEMKPSETECILDWIIVDELN